MLIHLFLKITLEEGTLTFSILEKRKLNHKGKDLAQSQELLG